MHELFDLLFGHIAEKNALLPEKDGTAGIFFGQFNIINGFDGDILHAEIIIPYKDVHQLRAVRACFIGEIFESKPTAADVVDLAEFIGFGSHNSIDAADNPIPFFFSAFNFSFIQFHEHSISGHVNGFAFLLYCQGYIKNQQECQGKMRQYRNISDHQQGRWLIERVVPAAALAGKAFVKLGFIFYEIDTFGGNGGSARNIRRTVLGFIQFNIPALVQINQVPVQSPAVCMAGLFKRCQFRQSKRVLLEKTVEIFQDAASKRFVFFDFFGRGIHDLGSP
jgi:hypothetical protein